MLPHAAIRIRANPRKTLLVSFLDLELILGAVRLTYDRDSQHDNQTYISADDVQDAGQR